MNKKTDRGLGSAHMDEAEWWDKYGYLNDRIWQYDDCLNGVIRREYLDELQGFLFKKGGRLLDFGCGTGQFSLPLAQQGMMVDGIDISPMQIRAACEQAKILGLVNTHFWCADSISEEQRGTYDAVLLHAVVHHIPVTQRKAILGSITDALVMGGKLCIYDPLEAMINPPWQAWFADTIVRGSIQLLRLIARIGRLYDTEIAAAMVAGWRNLSSDEQPARLNELLDCMPPELSVVKISPWHCWSNLYASFCMCLQPTWRQWLERAAPLVYRLDRRILSTAWYPYFHSWPLISILAKKNA